MSYLLDVSDYDSFDSLQNFEKKTEEKEILNVEVIEVVDSNTIIVDAVPDDNVIQIFVYGKKTNDFHTLDKEQLFTLNIGATQKLTKKVETLETENTQLKSQIQDLINRVSLLENAS